MIEVQTVDIVAVDTNTANTDIANINKTDR